MPRMIGRATARKDELGAKAEPALKNGMDEGVDEGAWCGIRGVERTGTRVGGA